MQMTASKAWAAFLTAAAGLAAIYGVKIALPDQTTLETILNALLPIVTAGVTYFVPNKPLPPA
jgi:hypothetical protein